MQKRLISDYFENGGTIVDSVKKHKNLKLGIYSVDNIYEIDCIEGMKHLPSKCVDIAIADPPYNLSKGGNWKWDNSVDLPGFGGNWSKVMETWDNIPLVNYLAFTLDWLAELKRIVKSSGSIWIHGTYHNIGIINFALQLLEIEIINEIIWYKRNSFPNLSGRRLTASHETILWAHTGKKRDYYFNYEYSKEFSSPEDLLKMPGKQMRTVWDIPNNKEKDEIAYGKHPTQKPIRLLARILNLSSKPGDICLIPFAGSGSDCIAALKSNRYFLAFEIDPKYVQIANKRLQSFYDNNKIMTPVEDDDMTSALKLKTKKNKESNQITSIPSLIKWTGSKRSQAFIIASYLPKYNRYFEPFLGGGALLFLAAKPNSIAGDIFEPLISFWNLIKNEPEKIINNYNSQWKSLQEQGYTYFYEVRERFNRNMNPYDLIFLSRTCVNGIMRFNKEGKFNNSFHVSRPGMSPEKFQKIVYQWSDRIQGVHFICQDYLKTISNANEGDFVYFDPPYACNKDRYTQDLDQEEFFNALANLNENGVKWALSFDGRRGTMEYQQPFPEDLFKRQLFIRSGNSAVKKVLQGPIESVEEALYLNY